MNKNMNLPAEYVVLSEEEMTYTSGGDGFTAPFAVGAGRLAQSFLLQT